VEDARFDLIARRLAISSNHATTRRGAFAKLGGAMVFVSALSRGETASAAGSGTCRAADPSQYITKQQCNVLSSGNTPGCLCIQTLGHVPECVIGFNPNASGDCPKEDECNDKNPCRGGFVCAKTRSCCGSSFRKCLRRCPA